MQAASPCTTQARWEFLSFHQAPHITAIWIPCLYYVAVDIPV